MLAGLLRWDRQRRLRPVALQGPEAEALLADLTPEQRMASWHLIAPSGERRSAGDAIPPLLRQLPRGSAPAAGFRTAQPLTNRGYRWVAGHRIQLSRFVPSSLKRRASALVAERERELTPR